MAKLPKGYYAVQADFETAPRDTFVFKGVTYEVEEGVNLFATPHEADAAAKEIPETVLDGVSYSAFEAPVLLFSVGRHKIDKCPVSGSRYWLGQAASVNPNVWGEDPTVCPAYNEARVPEEESVLFGTHYHGYVLIDRPDAEQIVFDGFTLAEARTNDVRVTGEGVYTEIFRNNIYKSPCGRVIHSYNAPKADCRIDRTLVIEDARMEENFDDLGYGGNFIFSRNSRTVLRRFFCNGTAQVFGFTTITRNVENFMKNREITEIAMEDCYFSGLAGENGIATSCTGAKEQGIVWTVDRCTFVNASREGEAVLHPDMPNEKCSLTVRDSHFIDTRGNARAIMVRGGGTSVTVENTSFEGFETEWAPAPFVPTKAPKYVRNYKRDWTTDTEDPHRVIGTNKADFTALDVRYEGRKAYYADLHTHTNCGGRSDGSFPMKDVVARMDELGYDFCAVVDHRQMRGYFLPEWDTDRFLYGTEPGGGITDPKGCPYEKHRSFHYNMLFKDEYGLAMVLANFPEYNFQGDRLTGEFGYPKFTRARFEELVAYVQKIGGIMVHPHPSTLLCSHDPLDYYFGEHTFLETLVSVPYAHSAFRNYDLWCKILALGKHMYTSGGSDTHSAPRASSISTLYLTERTGRACFDCMRTGDLTVGGFGFKMCIDGQPMGSELAYRKGMKLTLRVDDYFAPGMKDDTAYELRIYSDKGLAYASMFSGKEPQAISLEVQERRFYRAEVFDLTHGYRVAVGNPIWLDG